MYVEVTESRNSTAYRRGDPAGNSERRSAALQGLVAEYLEHRGLELVSEEQGYVLSFYVSNYGHARSSSYIVCSGVKVSLVVTKQGEKLLEQRSVGYARYGAPNYSGRLLGDFIRSSGAQADRGGGKRLERPGFYGYDLELSHHLDFVAGFNRYGLILELEEIVNIHNFLVGGALTGGEGPTIPGEGFAREPVWLGAPFLFSCSKPMAEASRIYRLAFLEEGRGILTAITRNL